MVELNNPSKEKDYAIKFCYILTALKITDNGP